MSPELNLLENRQSEVVFPLNYMHQFFDKKNKDSLLSINVSNAHNRLIAGDPVDINRS